MGNNIDLVPVEYDKDGRPRRYEVVRDEQEGPADVVHLPGPDQLPARVARAQVVVEGSYYDRARAFSLKTWQLAAVTAVLVFIASKWIVGYPLLSLVALLWIASAFFATWILAFVLDLATSPEGVEFFDVWSLWSYLRREQRERHKRHGAPQPTSWRFWLVAAGLLLCGGFSVGMAIMAIIGR